MSFAEELKHYMDLAECSAKELSKKTGISGAAISRYVNGKREPDVESGNIEKLSDALCDIAGSKSVVINKTEIISSFEKSIRLSRESYDFEDFVWNFKLLQEELNLSNASMGKALGYDASYISRIKSSERKPAEIDEFINRITNYIMETYSSAEKKAFMAGIFECKSDELKNGEKYKARIKSWLLERHTGYNEMIHGFLKKLDDFSLDDYINEDFSKVKVVNSPIILRGGKNYYGVEGRKNAEEEFMKLTLISKSSEPIFFYNDLPMAKAAEDEEFKKRYMMAMAMLLKKGLHLNMVHNIDRPMDEMILGMEGWFPMYMTGAISPYYFPKKPSDMFCMSHMTSGSVALSGELLGRNQERGKFYVTTKKEELPYYKAKSRYMLKKAKPLMVIYTADMEKEYEEFLKSEDDGSIENIKSSTLKNMNFTVSRKWVVMNKELSPKIHFVIYNEKLGNAIRTYLKEK